MLKKLISLKLQNITLKTQNVFKCKTYGHITGILFHLTIWGHPLPNRYTTLPDDDHLQWHPLTETSAITPMDLTLLASKYDPYNTNLTFYLIVS